MKEIIKAILSVTKMPKKTITLTLAGIASLVFAGTVFAWSPDRPTYTIENPAPHVTFNSITNNPNYGDERTFFDAKDAANTGKGGFVDKVNVQSGQEVLLRVYVHNNAADNLNDPNFTGPGVAKNTKVRIHLPTASANALRANAYVSADNAAPKEVADTVDLAGNGAFSVSYVPGSAVAYTNAVPSGIKLNDSIVTTGAPVGYNQADGVVPGCFKYDMIVTIKVKVQKPAYNVAKTVRFEGQTSSDWKESVTAKPGQTVEWRVAFTNTGSTSLKNVIVLDKVPAGMTVVPGSVRVFNANNPNGHTYQDNQAIQANGTQINVNIGDYAPTANAFVLFKTKVPAEDKLECGTSKFVNEAFATPEGSGSVNDIAQVETSKVCVKPAVTPPTQLPVTGPGDVVGIFAATTVAGALAYRLFWARRTVRQ